MSIFNYIIKTLNTINNLNDDLIKKLPITDKVITSYGYFRNKSEELWNNIYKQNYKNILSDEAKKAIKFNDIDNFFTNDYETIQNFKDSIPEISKYIKSQKGGSHINLRDFTIKIEPIKKSNDKNKKVISCSLFFPYYDPTKEYKEPVGKAKTPSFYAKILLALIEDYKYYLPEWKVRLYIDDSVPHDTTSYNKTIPKEYYELIQKFKNDTEDRLELFNVNFGIFLKKKITNKNIGHVGLIGVLFRYLILYDKNVTTTFIGDVDNYTSFLHAKILEDFSKSNSDILLFKPIDGYERIDINDNCKENILAGMIGFNKKQEDILDKDVFNSIFLFIEYFYNEQKNDPSTRNCIPISKKDNPPYLETPFYYGYEENTFTHIFIPLIDKFKLKTFTIPFYFNSSIKQFPNYAGPLLNTTNLKYVDYIFMRKVCNMLLINTECIFTLDTNNKYFENRFFDVIEPTNFPIYFLLFNILEYYAINNINKVTINGYTYNIFNSISEFRKNIIFEFQKNYPPDINESYLGYIYGEKCFKYMNQLLIYFTNNKFYNFNIIHKEFINIIKQNLVHLKNFDIPYWVKPMIKNIDSNMILYRYGSNDEYKCTDLQNTIKSSKEKYLKYGIYGYNIEQNVLHAIQIISNKYEFDHKDKDLLNSIMYFITDPSYVAVFHSMLRYLVKYRNGNNLFMFDSGNSLGYYRYNGHLPWDDDVDLAMKFDNYQELRNFLIDCIKNGFIVGLYRWNNKKWSYDKELHADVDYINNNLEDDFTNESMEIRNLFIYIRYNTKYYYRMARDLNLKTYYRQDINNSTIPWLDIFPYIKDPQSDKYKQAGLIDKSYSNNIDDKFKIINYFGLELKIMENIEKALMNTYGIESEDKIKSDIYINNHLLGLKGLKRDSIKFSTDNNKIIGKFIEQFTIFNDIKIFEFIQKINKYNNNHKLNKV
mgnify:CR=1 FL=1